jgi:hypothetical protein
VPQEEPEADVRVRRARERWQRQGSKDVDESRGAELGRELEHDRFQAAGVARVKASREFRDRVAGIGEPRDLGGGRHGRRLGLKARSAGHHS